MSEEERNLAIAREGLEAFRRGDIETFLNLLDPEVEVFSHPRAAQSRALHGPRRLSALGEPLARRMGGLRVRGRGL